MPRISSESKGGLGRAVEIVQLAAAVAGLGVVGAAVEPLHTGGVYPPLFGICLHVVPPFRCRRRPGWGRKNSGRPGADELSHGGGKVVPADGLVGVVKPQGEAQARQAVACHGPVGDVVVDLGGPHVVEVLGIVRPAHCLHGAGELVLLVHHLPEGVEPAVLP